MTEDPKQAIRQALEEALNLSRHFAGSLVALENAISEKLKQWEGSVDPGLTQPVKHAGYTFIVTANRVKDEIAATQHLIKQELARLEKK